MLLEATMIAGQGRNQLFISGRQI